MKGHQGRGSGCAGGWGTSALALSQCKVGLSSRNNDLAAALERLLEGRPAGAAVPPPWGRLAPPTPSPGLGRDRGVRSATSQPARGSPMQPGVVGCVSAVWDVPPRPWVAGRTPRPPGGGLPGGGPSPRNGKEQGSPTGEETTHRAHAQADRPRGRRESAGATRSGAAGCGGLGM